MVDVEIRQYWRRFNSIYVQLGLVTAAHFSSVIFDNSIIVSSQRRILYTRTSYTIQSKSQLLTYDDDTIRSSVITANKPTHWLIFIILTFSTASHCMQTSLQCVHEPWHLAVLSYVLLALSGVWSTATVSLTYSYTHTHTHAHVGGLILMRFEWQYVGRQKIVMSNTSNSARWIHRSWQIVMKQLACIWNYVRN